MPLFTKDGNYFKWSHKSLQEYFAALFVYYDTKERQKEILLHICFHEENDSFLNVIDLYRSIDPLGFDQTITYKFIKDFALHIDLTYKGFEGDEKYIRQVLTFGHDIFLINFPFEPENEENHPKELFNILRKHTKLKRGAAIGIYVVSDENTINCIKVPEIRNPYQTLVEFYFNNKYSFVKREELKKLSEKVDLKLTKRKLFKVSDRLNSILNTPENFTKTNNIILLFLARNRFLTIDLNAAISELEKIEKSIKNTNSDDLTNF